MIPRILFAASLFAMVAYPAVGADVRSFDIRGVKLGDTIDQVKARFPEMTFRQLKYWDSRYRRKYQSITGALLDRIDGRIKTKYERFEVNFTGGGNVYQVSLSQDLGDAACGEVFEKITAKFGQPSEVYTPPNNIAGRWYHVRKDYISKALSGQVYCYAERNTSLSLELFDHQRYKQYLSGLKSMVAEAMAPQPSKLKRNPNF